MPEYISVETSIASSVIKDLRKRRLIRTDLKITRSGNNVMIPVKSAPPDYAKDIITEGGRYREVPKSPYGRVLDLVLGEGIPREMVPDKWIRYGDSIALRLNGNMDSQYAIAGAYAKVLGVKTVYRIDGGIRGEIREPTMKLIYGPGGEVQHTENGIKYEFDPSRVMFSPGNVNERVSMKNFPSRKQRVLDMFAGIGYFSLPVAKYTDPELVQCCEINPISARFLRGNSEINNVSEKIKISVGDVRLLKSNIRYGLIIMGNFESASFIAKALSMAGDRCTIILHHLVSTDRLITFRREMNRRFLSFSYVPSIIDSHIVKSVGPNYYHVSTTIEVTRII
ncbi:MAG: methyltransferase [Thermoplasmataceae archaeon]